MKPRIDETEHLTGCTADEHAPAVMVLGDPLRPVDLVEEPIHYQQEDGDRDSETIASNFSP